MSSNHPQVIHPTQEEWNQIIRASDKDLIAILNKRSVRDEVLEIAMREVAQRNLHCALPILIGLLNDTNTTVKLKTEATWAIARIGGKDVFQLVVKTYRKTRSYELKRASLRALGEIKSDESLAFLIDKLEKARRRLEKITTSSPPWGQDETTAFSLWEPLDIPKDIIDSLGRLQDKRAVPPLLEFVKILLELDEMSKNSKFKAQGDEPIWTTLCSLVSTVRQLNDQRAISGLIQILKVENPFHFCIDCQRSAFQALETLGFLKNPTASEVLIDIYRKSKQPYLWGIISVLEKIGDQKSIDFLRAESERSEEARNALGRLKFERGLPICDCCGQLRELQPIEESTGQYLEICQSCWVALEPLQANPDTRTVVSCGWENRDSPTIASGAHPA